MEDHLVGNVDTRSLPEFLRSARDQIVHAWEQEVRASEELVRVRELSRPHLLDDMPNILDRLADAVKNPARTQDTVGPLAEKHALHRFELGFDLPELVLEYGILRHVLHKTWIDSGGDPLLPGFERLHAALDRVVLTAVDRYAREAQACFTRESTRATENVRDLLHVTEAALAASLDEVLEEILDRIAKVTGADTAALLIAEDGRGLRLKASRGLESSVAPNLIIAPGEGFAGRIFSEKMPLVVEDASSFPIVAPLAREKVRSLAGAPLRVGDRITGVVHVGFAQPRRFEAHEVDFLQVCADRIAVVLENARLYDTAQSAVRSRDRLMATVSHDLRNPVASIVLNATSLLSAATPDERTRRRAEAILRAAGRATRIIEDLTSVALIEAGRVTVKAAPEDASDLIHEAVEILEPMAGESGVRLVVEDVDGRVLVDRDHLVRVLLNLGANAIRFSPQAGAVRFRAEVREREVVFSVVDEGPGLSDEVRDRLFERGFRGADGQQPHVHGLGLGLPIAKGLLEAQGGRIWVDSVRGKGATFHFSVPRVDAG